MAGTSPARRSSRARTTQPQPQTSSATSSASGRLERSTRAFTKTGSPQKSTGSGSLSSEPPEESTATTASSDEITVLRRRSARGKDEDREKQPKIELSDMAIISDDNEIHEDDEAVRCVCGFEDYPGPPPFDDEMRSLGLRDAIDLVAIFTVESENDMTGFFVQCDICKVWEHGLCVGIVSEDSSPDEYYCEVCRKDLHKIYTASNGQKYSIYLPIHRPSRTTSRATSAVKDGVRSPKSSERRALRQSGAEKAAAAAKRRLTMNSRDAAYDEEEQLRRAIEASKEETLADETDITTRRPKRIRDEDEEPIESIKRQRTTSKSPSPMDDQVLLASREDSEDESGLRNGSKKSVRNAVRSQREKAEREERREEQERKRTEAANKRKGRAERRRLDGTSSATSTIIVKFSEADVDMDIDSDPSEEMPLAARVAVTRPIEPVNPPEPPPPASSQPAPDTPPADKVTSSIHKKKPVSQHKKGKGRNQYTKERDAHDNDTSPARSMSRDVPRSAEENGVPHIKATTQEAGSRQTNKSKGGMSSKITMSDLKRRANNILEFITRTQVELVSEPLSEKSSPRHTANDDTSVRNAAVHVNGSREPAPTENGNRATVSAREARGFDAKDFKELNCVEMMDALTRDLVKWQQEYAP